MKILMFFSQFCPPCRATKPNLIKVAESRNIEVEFVDGFEPENGALVSKYNVVYIPTILAVDDEGKEINRIRGYQSEFGIDAFVDAIMANAR